MPQASRAELTIGLWPCDDRHRTGIIRTWEETILLRIDPEFAALIPPLSAEELAGLEASILAEGCRDAMVAWRGFLLDGHNRHEICTRRGIKFKTISLDLPNRASALLWIEENQLGRRNLTDDQRAAIAYRVQQRRSKLARQDRARKAGQAGGRNHPKVSLEAASASKLKTGGRAAERTRTVVALQARVSERKLRSIAEIAKADPDVLQQIVEARTTIKQAARRIRERQLQQALAAIPANLPAKTDRYRVIRGDIAKVGDRIVAPAGRLGRGDLEGWLGLAVGNLPKQCNERLGGLPTGR